MTKFFMKTLTFASVQNKVLRLHSPSLKAPSQMAWYVLPERPGQYVVAGRLTLISIPNGYVSHERFGVIKRLVERGDVLVTNENYHEMPIGV